MAAPTITIEPLTFGLRTKSAVTPTFGTLLFTSEIT